MIAKRLLAIQKASYGSGGGGVVIPSTDVYYDYRSLILNMQGSAGSTTFTDSSPNNFAVTPYGNAQLASDATFGTVASFDGNGDFISIPDNSVFGFGTGDFTLEAWVKLNSPITATSGDPSYRAIINKFSAGSSGTEDSFMMLVNNASGTMQITLIFMSNTTTTSFTFNIPNVDTQLNSVWNHITAVRQSGSIKVYFNGSQIGTTQTYGSSINQGTLPVLIGARTYNPYDLFYNGLIGPLRISPWAVYKSNFTPSVDLFPAIQGVPAQDPYYDKNSLLLNMQGSPSSTVFVDESPNAFTVTRNGDTVLASDATFGTVASFDGNGDYFSVASNAAFAFGTGDFTIEGWFYASSIGSNTALIEVANASNVGLMMRQNTNNSLLIYNRKTATILITTATNSLVTNTWQYIAVVRYNGTLTVYINGTSAGSASSVTTSFDSTSMTVGGFYDGTSAIPYGYNGRIGPLRITKGFARYTSNFTPPTGLFPEIYNPYTTLPVSGAALWLDGADSSTLFTDAGVTPVTKSGDLVYQWSDKSGNNRHATQVTSANRPTWVPPASGRNGLGALAFNGSSQYIDRSAGAATQFSGDFTIEMWIKLNTAKTQSFFDTRISETNPYGNGFVIAANASNQFLFYQFGNRIISSGVATGQWNHLAICRSGSSIKMFLNGTQTGSTYTSSTNYSDGGFLIGTDYPRNARWFDGVIQNLIVYNGQALYTSNFTPWMS